MNDDEFKIPEITQAEIDYLVSVIDDIVEEVQITSQTLIDHLPEIIESMEEVRRLIEGE